jgi:glycosyltransferase involved in cell wall biosynthesis
VENYTRGTRVRTYDKRIGFLVSYQTLIPHGGIGQFTKSFCELMDRHNIKVDIITDKKPDDDFISELKKTANIIAPDKPSIFYTGTDKHNIYGKHSSIFMYGDTFCYERMANFRDAMVKAISSNLYDAFICNTYETVQVASTMGLEDCIQIIAYTHLESQIFKDTKNPFLYNTNVLMRQQLETDNVYVGTQSIFNLMNVNGTAYHLPIPITEKSLLEEHHKQREGILFVGRWEEGKNPELFLELIEQTKLPAKVMTSTNGAKKFEERLKKIGVPYDIRIGIIGQEKVDFMTSARIAFNPSVVESYGMAFYEQHIQMPTLVLENQRWTNNFNKDFFYTCTKKNMAEKAKELYDIFEKAERWYNLGSLQHAQEQEANVFHKWNTCFNAFEAKKSNSNTAKILENTTVNYSEFIDDLGRNIICIDDVRSVLTNKHKYRVIYTNDNTYLSKDPNFEPTEELTGASLFSFE